MSELQSIYKFKPIRGLEKDLMNVAHTEGAILVATDTGKMWMDTPTTRVSLGGSGASLLYAQATNVSEQFDDVGNYYYLIAQEDLEDHANNPQVNDLILNSDGSFYRIIEISEDYLTCNRIAVSGSGGGGGSVSVGTAMTFRVYSLPTYTLVNNQTMSVEFLATSAKDAEGVALDDDLIINWSLKVSDTGVSYDSGNFTVLSGERATFEFGSRLRASTSSTLTLTCSGLNQTNTVTRTVDVKTVELLLEEPVNFSNASTFSSTNVEIGCNVTGNLEKILDYYIDGELVSSVVLGASVSGPQSYVATGLSHGYHTIQINLYQYVNNERMNSVEEPLEYEIAVTETGNTTPIIWLGDYKDEYYKYDAIKIPYYVYTPGKDESTVIYVKGITEEAPRTVANNTYSIWQITDADEDIQNSYFIRVMKTGTLAEDEEKYVSREINFTVVEDPNRDISLQSTNNLMISFDASGRSNTESETKRQTWSYTDGIVGSGQTYTGTFTNFNWYNNGWKLDENNDTMLRISNGAQFSVNLGNTVINNSATSTQQSRTFEFEFKLRNIQDYSNLIKEYTRYSGDSVYWEQFQAQITYDNYDAFLKNLCDQSDGALDYDTITGTFDHVERVISDSAAFCEYCDSNNHGFKLGPQDGFFASQSNTLSFDYVEDKIINLSIIFDYSSKRIYVYVQGILTAVSNIDDSQALRINADNIIFKSDYCDVDLYKFRVYNTGLSVRDVLINYATDHSDVLVYDHTTKLASYNTTTKEYQLNYSAIADWNSDSGNFDQLLMPYVIFDTGSASVELPNSKADKKNIIMTFVNPALDRAYQNGTLDELADQMTDAQKAAAAKEGLSNVQYYYKHHCPSFTSVQQQVSLAVQGTSSQAYPRRNYKAKTKSGDTVYMYMNKGPFADTFANNDLDTCNLDFFYYNNYSVGTTKFTLKVDYMESSGTYNMGLANLVHTAYEKHPLDDYNTAGAFNKVSTTYELATANEAVENAKYFIDEKGKTAIEFTEETPYEANKYYIANNVYTPYNFDNTAELRTNVQGFPVMAFWKYGNTSNDYRFIGRYNMLLDKGSDEVYGFKPSKSITQAFSGNKATRNIVECWEFSNNQRGYCSFKDPYGRHKLSFDYIDSEGNRALTGNGAPSVADSYEYRYNSNEDLLDYIYGDTSLQSDLVEDGYDINNLTNSNWKAATMLNIYRNWEKANQWVWSTYTDIVPSAASVADGTATARKIMDYELATGQVYDSNETYYDKYEDIISDMSTHIDSDNNILEDVYIGVPKTVTYGDIEYEYETKEYRLAKFKNEFSKHFDLDYSLVYFVITEVMLAYDSRGKNCMMASWGPKEESGDYIWYPVFYDMDTQLGINNTGIPSFEYSANATLDGTFSTSDSVLWNNLYTCFYDNIKSMYNKLRGVNLERGGVTSVGPLSSVTHIENWYLAQPFNDEITEAQIETAKLQHLEMCGDRPLIMFNMDEFYKYISITNSAIGYQLMGEGHATDNGSYYYALQGDRSLSRQQFLTKRIKFIDSWFGVRSYQKDGGVQLQGRFGANNANTYSDKWITEARDDMATYGLVVSPYYTEDGSLAANGRRKKVNYLDTDNYLTITPTQSSYVALYVDDSTTASGDKVSDNAEGNSLQYKENPVIVDIPGDVFNKINNETMRENLIYIMGAGDLQDIGDVSKLYWSEFKAPSATKLSRLLLGNDDHEFYNKGVFTDPVFDANATTQDGGVNTGKPLLKEVNLSGITFSTADQVFDFTSSEKLRIFKGLRSNFKEIKFAEGVALHTLYLPSTVQTLSLVEANNLTNILGNINVSDKTADNYYSTYDEVNDAWIAKQGLYIAGLTNLEITKDSTISENASCSLSQLNIDGGALGYDSYDLVYALYRIYKEGQDAGSRDLKIALKNVDWSPYKQLDEDTIYVASQPYFKDDGHYGFVEYIYVSATQWKLDLMNGLVYLYDATESENQTKITDLNMLLDFMNLSQFKNITSIEDNSIPVLTGNIYVDNTEAIDEYEIRNILLNDDYGFSESTLNIHFANVDKKYKATFIQEEEDGTQTIIGTQVLNTLDRFNNPYTTYKDSAKRDNYDFLGWATSNSEDDVIISGDWNTNANTIAVEGTYDYVYYAVFVKHTFSMQFKVGTVAAGFSDATDAIGVIYGDLITEPNILPYLDDSELDETERYTFIGWTQDRTATIAASRERAKTVNVDKIIATSDMIFYAVFVKENVYDSVLDDKYLTFNLTSDGTGYAVSLNRWSASNSTGIKPEDLKGKITLPAYHDGLPITHVSLLVNSGTTNGPFSQCSNLTYVFFEEGCQVQSFGMACFAECTNLVKVELPETLTTIGGYAFMNCTSLMNTVFAGNITSIGQRAFSSAGKSGASVDLVFGSKITYMGPAMLQQGAWTVNNITFGDNVSGSSNLLQIPISTTDRAIIYSASFTLYSITVYYKNEAERASLEELFKNTHFLSNSCTISYIGI